ncbi:MFS transporter [Pseudomonas sp. NPDC089534]|uniref:MFS transporter n=1 Tax=Pseudomonas sp. NPDC089534 TaxID=3364468 RepID=UPI003809D41A
MQEPTDGAQATSFSGASAARLSGTFLISGFVMAALGSSRLIVPLIAISLGAGSMLVGVIAAACTAMPMVLSVAFGRWMDRAGTLPAIGLATSMIIFASLLYWALPSRYTLLAVSGLIGTAGVFTHMAATRAVGLGVKVSERAKSLGYLVLSYSLFNFFGPVIASHAFEHFGAVPAIGVLGLFALLSVIGTRAVPHFYAREEQRAADASGPRRAYDLLKTGDLRLWIVISGIFTANQTLYPFILSLHAAQIGLAASQAGWMLGAFAFGTLTSRFCTPLLVKHANPNITLVIALVLAAGIYAVIPSAHGTVSLVVLSAALGLPLGIGAPVSLALIYEVAPPGRVNEALGISMSVNNLLQTVFPMLIGVAASSLGVAPMVWVWSLVILVSACMIMLRRHQLERGAA